MSWRQADCHINNLYNTCFWVLVQQGGKTETEAEAALCGTVSADKNELLFSQFNINYNTLPALHRKGSVLSRRKVEREEFSATSGVLVKRMRNEVVVEHVDVIGDEYWLERPGLLLGEDVRPR